MDKKQLQSTLGIVKKNSPKRNFTQSIDLVMNLKDIDLKNPEQSVNMFITLHQSPGKNVSICALVGPELEEKAKATCNETVLLSDFDKFKDKKDMKKLADKHDFFIAQAPLMAKIASTFGRVFGPRGKMPNPKVGAVVPPNANLEPLVQKLKNTLHLQTKNDMTIRCMVGKEDTPEEEVIDNILTVYNAILHKLPNEKNNIKNVFLKTTMGPSVEVGGEAPSNEKKPAQKAEEKEAAAEKPVEESQSQEEPKEEAKEAEASE